MAELGEDGDMPMNPSKKFSLTPDDRGDVYVAETEEHESWGYLIKGYSQDTTMHGVRYLSSERSISCRRLVWLILLICALVGFVLLMSIGITRLRSKPKVINVEIQSRDQLKFPAVTICPLSTLSKTKITTAGLDEMIDHHKVATLLAGKDQAGVNGTCADTYTYQGLFCSLPDVHVLTSVPEDRMSVVNVSRLACRRICTHVIPEFCAGYFYHAETRTCVAGPFTAESTSTICNQTAIEFYKRSRCLDDTLRCTFDSQEEKCPLVYNSETVHNSGSNYYVLEPWRITNNTENGESYLQWKLPGNDNKLKSALMRTGFHNTTGKFLSFRVNIILQENQQAKFGYFAVYLKGERYLDSDIMILFYSATWSEPGWKEYTYSLPHGVYDVIFEVQKKTYQVTEMELLIDDLMISGVANESLTVSYSAEAIQNTKVRNKTVSTVNLTNYVLSKYGEIGMNILYDQYTFSKDSILKRCEFEKADCRADSLREVITNSGKCVTFNGDKEQVLHTQQTGAVTGLRLVLSPNTYDGLATPENTKGVKILLHEQGDFADTANQGFVITNRMHGIASISATQTINLKPPYGNCTDEHLQLYPGIFTTNKCRLKCQTEAVDAKCDCKMHYMEGSTKYCTLWDQNFCLKDVDEPLCACPPACDTVRYTASLSYASVDASDKLTRDQTQQMEQSFNNSFDMQMLTRDDYLGFIALLHDAVYDFIDLEEAMMHTLGNWIYNYDKYRADLPTATQALLQITKDDVSAVLDLPHITRNINRLSTIFNAYNSDFYELESIIGRVSISHESKNSISVMERYRGKLQHISNNVVTHILAFESLLSTNRLNNSLEFGDEGCWETIERLQYTVENVTFLMNNPDTHLNVSGKRLLNDLSSANKMFIDCWQPYIRLLEEIDSYHLNVSSLSVTDLLGAPTDGAESKNNLLRVRGNIGSDMLRLTRYYTDYIQHGNSSLVDMCRHVLAMFDGNTAALLEIQDPATYDLTSTFNFRRTEITMKAVEEVYATAINYTGRLSYYFGDLATQDSIQNMSISRKPFWDSYPVPGVFYTNGMEQNASTIGRESLIRDRIMYYYMEILPYYFGTESLMASTIKQKKKFDQNYKKLSPKLHGYLDEYEIDLDGVRTDLVTFDLFYGEKKLQVIEQQIAYTWQNFLSELGGNLGLLLGGSVITVCEVLDLLLFNGLLKCGLCRRKKRPSAKSLSRV